MDYRIEFNAPVVDPPASMPEVTVSAVGELLCAYSTCWEPFPRGGELRIVRSRDEGRTWSQPELVWRSPDPRVTVTSCVGMMTMGDGTILLPAGYNIVPKREDPPGTSSDGDGESNVIGLYDLRSPKNLRRIHCLRSGDHGQTWVNVSVGGPPPRGGIMRFGRILELQSGDLLLPAYNKYPEEGVDGKKSSPGFFRSRNGGWTWDPFEPVDVDWTSEMNLLELHDGTLLAIIRGMPGQKPGRTFGMTRSTDGGKTWSKAKPTIGVQGKMPDLWETPDSRLVLVVGGEGNADGSEIYRKRDRRTFNVLFISDDAGETWQRDVEIPPLDEVTEAIPSDEPTMVPLGDGRYFVVSQVIDRGKERTGHPVDWDYYFSLQCTILAPN